ncbi:MAG: GHKL domain-containing protein [Oscillospiraceae bacterium]|nr:GHKL domain-containing protein [Oscillospiraceae bacterium]
MKQYILECILACLYIFEGVAFESFLMNKLFGYRFCVKKAASVVFFSFLLLSTAAALLFIGDRYAATTVPDTASMLAFVIGPYFLFKSKKKMTFFWFGFVFAVTSDFVVLTVRTYLKLTSFLSEAICYVVLFSLLTAIIFAITKFSSLYVPQDFFEQIPSIVYVVIIIADLAAFYGATLAEENSYRDVYQVLTLLSATLVVGCLSFVIYKYSSAARAQKEAENQLSLQLKHYEDLMQMNKDIRSFRHDIKNNLFSLNALISEGKIKEAQNYIDELGGKVSQTEKTYFTGNRLADAIISDKARDAKKSGVNIIFDGTIPESGISNYDLCTILSNALSNAVEACKDLSGSDIIVKGKESKMGFSLTVRNPVKNKVVIKNGNIKTSKSDSKNHGFGIKNIKTAVKKYDGFVDMSCDEFFSITASVILKREGV